MDGNKFGRVGGLALAGSLQVNTTLEELDITNTEQVTFNYSDSSMVDNL